MNRFARNGWVAAALLAASCGRHVTPIAVSPPPPPRIVEVHPAPRSTGNSDVPEVWIQFDGPMDTLAVGRNVTLKLDTQFVPIDVTWERDATRLVFHPEQPLALFRTYTVRLGPTVARQGGGSIDLSYMWQFKTASVVTPRQPIPADDATGESPFVSLFWDRGRTNPDDVDYAAYAGRDSEVVALHQVPPLRAAAAPNHFVPTTTWGLGATVYWSIRVHNRRTGEVQDGPVWRFHTLPVDTPYDSVALDLSDWGDVGPDEIQGCFADTFATGGARRAAIRWDLRPLGAVKLLSAKMSLAVENDRSNLTPPSVYASLDYWPACDIEGSGPPHTDFGSGPVAVLRRNGLGTFEASNDGLVAFVEAMTRYRGFFGFVLIGPTPVTFRSAETRLKLRIARAGAPGAVAAWRRP